MGLAGSAVGRGAFQYTDFQASDEEGNIVWNNVKIEDASSLEEAYEVIKKELGIPVLKLNYIPTGMVFAGLEIIDNRAVIKFDYNGYTVRLTEISQTEDSASVHISDRKEYQQYQNKLLGEKIILSKNILDNGDIEYGAEVSTEIAYYYLSAIMEEEEFIQITQMMYLK